MRENIKGCKEIIQKHHVDLKHDPERLSSKFIADVAGCGCRFVDRKIKSQKVPVEESAIVPLAVPVLNKGDKG